MAAFKVAVFSDVHGNLLALEAVLADIQYLGPFNAIVAAGDHCLSGPFPAEAFDLVMESATHVLYGNTDRDIVSDGKTDPTIGRKKRDTIDWTREQLGEERLEKLGGLDFEARFEMSDGASLLVVHANPHDVDRHIFPDRSDEELQEIVGDVDASVLAFGHLHTPFTRILDGLTLVNIAAVGIPRDGDRRAAWGEFVWHEGEGWKSEIHRVEYDYMETVAAIHNSGMPHAEAHADAILEASYD